jgi:hypothetical protein
MSSKNDNFLVKPNSLVLIPVVVQHKVQVYSFLIPGVAGSNPAENKDIRLFLYIFLCVV